MKKLILVVLVAMVFFGCAGMPAEYNRNAAINGGIGCGLGAGVSAIFGGNPAQGCVIGGGVWGLGTPYPQTQRLTPAAPIAPRQYNYRGSRSMECFAWQPMGYLNENGEFVETWSRRVRVPCPQ